MLWKTGSYISGYVEKQYTIHTDGSWRSEIIHRLTETVHKVTTNTVHEIIELPEGECRTDVVPTSPRPVPWHFWKFDETGIYRRLPRERTFKPVQKH